MLVDQLSTQAERRRTASPKSHLHGSALADKDFIRKFSAVLSCHCAFDTLKNS
jgi:hypothetical protein